MHLLMFVLTLQQGPIRSGEDLIRAMHDRYAGKWYTTLSFVQHNTATKADGTQEHSTWHEDARIPGNLRIDFLPDSGNGLLFANDSEYVRQADTLAHPTGSRSSQARRAAAGTTTQGRSLRTTRSTSQARSVLELS